MMTTDQQFEISRPGHTSLDVRDICYIAGNKRATIESFQGTFYLTVEDLCDPSGVMSRAIERGYKLHHLNPLPSYLYPA